MQLETLLNKYKVPAHSDNLVERIIASAMVSNIFIFVPRPALTLPLIAMFSVFAGLWLGDLSADIGDFMTIEEDIL